MFKRAAYHIQRSNSRAHRTEATYRPKRGDGSYPVWGIWNNKADNIGVGTAVEIATQIPTYDIYLKYIPDLPTPDDEITIKNEVYRVSDSAEDGQGMSKLYLELLS